MEDHSTGDFRQPLLSRQVAGGLAIAVLAAAFSFSPAFLLTPARAAAGVPPFCVKRGGSLGPDSQPQICRWYDYQTCMQAAADLNGNCVVNIDYKGVVSREPVVTRERRAR
jgi:Protein of unknown function (DUF3551)